MGYFIYARKSEEDDGRQVQSIDDQLKLAQELAMSRGLTVVDVLTEAKSAKRPGRPVFMEMLKRIEAGEADGIIAWHPDRLSRNARDAGTLIDLLDVGTIRDLQFGSYTFENSPEGKWMLGIVLGQSKYFVDKLSKDVKRGMQSRLEKGHFPGRAPAGYINNLASKTIDADPERFELVRRAFRLVLANSCSVPEVLGRLNTEWGFRTHRTAKTGGGALPRSVFYKMLGNIFYTGQIYFDGKLYPGQHPPVITLDEFESIRQRLDQERIVRRRRRDKGGKGRAGQDSQADLALSLLHRPKLTARREFDFTGLMRCGRCGCRVTAEAKFKRYRTTGLVRTYIYYHCTNGKKICDCRGIRQEDVEAQVCQLLDQVTLQHWVVEWCLRPAREWHLSESGFGHKALDELMEALSRAEWRKSRLLDDRLNHPDLLTVEEFREQKAQVQEQITRLTGEIAATRQRLESVRETVENVFDFAVNARAAFEKGGSMVRREIAAKLGVKYSLTLGKLEIVPHPLLVPILTFEPPEIRCQNKKDSQYEAACLSWYQLRDVVLTLVIREGYVFTKTDWKQAEKVAEERKETDPAKILEAMRFEEGI